MRRVLIGSPVHQSKEILQEFLISLEELNTTELEVDYCFVDDNSEVEAKEILNNFKNKHIGKVKIFKSKAQDNYICDDYTHRWSQYLVQKVTLFKNKIIDVALQGKYDYLFFIDSDIVLHPKTLKRLIETDKEIISNIFWTRWSQDGLEMPQVWLQDSYSMHNFKSNQSVTPDQIAIETNRFMNMLKIPGTYKVGGLGACTLIKRSALSKGVNFNEVTNVSFWGEDRHFCIRAAVLGVGLWVDTYYPAYHIYRKSDLSGIEEYKEKCKTRDTEILGSKILKIIQNGISKGNSYGYNINICEDLNKYFSESESKRLKEYLEDKREATLTEGKCLVSNLKECELDFKKNTPNKVIATIKWSEEGYKDNTSFYDEYLGECTVEKIEEDKWIITDWSVDCKIEPKKKPLIRKAKEKNNKLTLSMIVKNEADRYLKTVLEGTREYIDSAVIIDDGSTDNTIEVVEAALKGIPCKIIRNESSMFHDEVRLRKQQWTETINSNPDWIIFLDSDEKFEDRFKDDIKDMMNEREVDGYLFRLYDFWDENNYRDDANWSAHKSHRLFMIRYQENFDYKFKETAQHCGRLPINAMELACKISPLRLKHYGWAKEEDRVKKYERYMKLDKNGQFGSLAQYKSILDSKPNLLRWNEHAE